jgi:mono/diheme cytochrome c family protein
VPRVIGTAAFVLVFILLGLSVVAVAMRSGRRTTAAGAARGESPGQRRAWAVALPIAALLIGIGVPLWILLVNADSHAKKGPGGIELSNAQVNGREIFAERCSNCHTLAASKAVGKVGPNLDNLRPPKELILDAIKNGRANGRGQMPAGVVDGQDAQDVAAYVSAVAGRANQ